MPGDEPSLHYQAYMLRCWAEPSAQPDHPMIWRFSIQDPHTGERRGFATFESLMEFLRQKLQDVLRDGASD